MRVVFVVLLLLAIPVSIVGWFVWREWRMERMRGNERAVHQALHQLYMAQRLMHAEDKDGDGVSNYWTADIAGLGNLARPYLADFDDVLAADPARPGGRPYRGYWFVVMKADDQGAPFGTRHPTRFALCAYPDRYGVTGWGTYIATDDRVTRRDLNGAPVLQRPPDPELRTQWPSCISG